MNARPIGRIPSADGRLGRVQIDQIFRYEAGLPRVHAHRMADGRPTRHRGAVSRRPFPPWLARP